LCRGGQVELWAGQLLARSKAKYLFSADALHSTRIDANLLYSQNGGNKYKRMFANADHQSGREAV
jgi:hypothetical protein